MEQAYFQAPPFSGGVRAPRTLSIKSIPTHPHSPACAASSFWLTRGRPTKISCVPLLELLVSSLEFSHESVHMETGISLTRFGVMQNTVSHCIFLTSGPVFL